MLTNRVGLLSRFFHISAPDLETSKGLLGKLRKKTGYSFSNCKKALEANENDLDKAEKWLQQQAKDLGWAKATKLAGRKTSQGLISIAIEGKHAAMIELNCETDFVARNKQFQNMAEIISTTCLQFTKQQIQPQEPFTKALLNASQLQSLQGPEDKSLGDHIAILISTVGENMLLKRAACITVDDGHDISAFTHPSPEFSQAGPMTGKFGALLVYKNLKNAEKQINVEDVARQLCQHVIGMNPSKIGTVDDIPAEDSEEETVMIHQEFLLDPDQYVGEVMTSAGIQPVEFLRFECGEQNEGDQNVEEPKTQIASAG